MNATKSLRGKTISAEVVSTSVIAIILIAGSHHIGSGVVASAITTDATTTTVTVKETFSIIAAESSARVYRSGAELPLIFLAARFMPGNETRPSTPIFRIAMVLFHLATLPVLICFTFRVAAAKGIASASLRAIPNPEK